VSKVEVVFALPERQRVVTLALPEAGPTAQMAVERSGLLDEFPELRDRPLVLGIYARSARRTAHCVDRDRGRDLPATPSIPACKGANARRTRHARVAQR